MAFSGVPEKEMPFLRNHARHAFPPSFFDMDDPLKRQRVLFELLAAYTVMVKRGSVARGEALEKGIGYARVQWEKSERRLRAQQVRRLPKLPNARETGATPEDDPMPSPKEARAQRTKDERTMMRDAHGRERPTQGHEKWDPKWGDPETPIPTALPQGMKRLPDAPEVEIRRKPGRPPGVARAPKDGTAP